MTGKCISRGVVFLYNTANIKSHARQLDIACMAISHTGTIIHPAFQKEPCLGHMEEEEGICQLATRNTLSMLYSLPPLLPKSIIKENHINSQIQSFARAIISRRDKRPGSHSKWKSAAAFRSGDSLIWAKKQSAEKESHNTNNPPSSCRYSETVGTLGSGTFGRVNKVGNRTNTWECTPAMPPSRRLEKGRYFQFLPIMDGGQVTNSTLKI